MILNVFCSGFVIRFEYGDFYLGFIIIIFFLILFIFNYRKVKLPAGYFYLMFFLILTGIISVFLGNNTSKIFLKQFITINVFVISYYTMFILYDNIAKIIDQYMNLVFLFSIIGIIQFFAYLLGIEPLYDFSWFIPKYGLDTLSNGFCV